MMLQDYVCIDLETTGLQPKTDRMIEIGAVKVHNGEIIERFETLVNPQRKLEERITMLTGIRQEELAAAPVLDDVFPALYAFLGDLPLLGHSVLFDYSFLKKAAVDRRLTFDRKGVDTLKIARKYLAELESRSLEYLCRHFDIPHRAHRALGDAEATDRLYRLLAERFDDGTEVLFAPQELIFRAKRDQPATKAQKERLYRLVKRHKLTLEAAIEGLSRSEASRLTDRLLSQYREG